MNYSFEPSGKKRGRNRFVGSWQETGWRDIGLPFTPDNLIVLLREGTKAESEFAHQDIAHWCDKFMMAGHTERLSSESEAVVGIAEDVSVQWDSFLVNTYALHELQTLDFARVRLPIEWFDNWLKQAEEARG